MGFLSSIAKFAKIVAPIALGVVAGEAGVAVAEALVAEDTPKAKAQMQITGRAVAPTRISVTAPLARARAEGVRIAGVRKNVVITTIDSFDAAGNVVSTEQLRGRPFLMQQDFVTAKRVIKALRKAAARIPKQTVKPSRTKMLTDAVLDDAMRRATCPPKGALPC